MNHNDKYIYDIIIIGGGSSGIMSAIYSKDKNKDLNVLLIEKNNELGKKLKITGGGRCNITNNEPNHNIFINNYNEAKDFLWSAFAIYGVADTFEFFQSRGLELKVENNNRVFPVTDSALSVFNLLNNELKRLNIEIKMNTNINKIEVIDNKITVITDTDNNHYYAKKYIISCGGASHPETGSDGFGFELLASVGHNIIPINSALVPLISSATDLESLSGIAFDNIPIRVCVDNKTIFKSVGKALITQFGLSGPGILGISKRVRELLPEGEVRISIDLMGDIFADKIDEYILSLININKLKKIKNIILPNISNKLWLAILNRGEVSPETKLSELKREDRLRINYILKNFSFVITGDKGAENAIVSAGGVDLREIEWREMSSKIISNLYITGDLLNIDRPSGGYSLQLCWTTGAIAGMSAGESVGDL